jgi:putative YphP/YqiW family bacilliredoxin
MKAELTNKGFEELLTPEAVDANLSNEGTTLLMINSVCGCSAGTARPGVVMALTQSDKRPTRCVTTFAGVDTAATNQARTYLLPYPPSSPAIALLKDGKLVHMIERHMIEGRSAQMIAANLQAAFDAYCD